MGECGGEAKVVPMEGWLLMLCAAQASGQDSGSGQGSSHGSAPLPTVVTHPHPITHPHPPPLLSPRSTSSCSSRGCVTSAAERPMLTAVSSLSPVIIHTTMPEDSSVCTASGTPSCGGVCINRNEG